MVAPDKIAKLLKLVAQGVAAHDRENPDHHTWGIGMAWFDIERLGLEEGEELLPGIVLHGDGGMTGQFRILCDGQHGHEETEEEEEILEVVSTQELAEPVHAPGAAPDPDRGPAPPLRPPF